MKQEQFDAWRSEPLTQWIFAAVKRAAAQEKAEWVRQSWDSGVADPAQLIELRTRANALEELIDNDFETWSAWHDIETNRA